MPDEPTFEPVVAPSVALSNPKRVPVGAAGNAVNMGWFALALVWLHAQIETWIPVDIDPASGLPIEGSVEGQQAVALITTAAAAAIFGFVSNVLKNISAGKEGTFAQRLGATLATRLP
jgi:hypothetical protein